MCNDGVRSELTVTIGRVRKSDLKSTAFAPDGGPPVDRSPSAGRDACATCFARGYGGLFFRAVLTRAVYQLKVNTKADWSLVIVHL